MRAATGRAREDWAAIDRVALDVLIGSLRSRDYREAWHALGLARRNFCCRQPIDNGAP